MAYYLNVPELGIIPSATAKAKLHMYYYGKKQMKATEKETEEEEKNGSVALLEAGKPTIERVELITMQNKASMVAESFRVVLTSLLFSGKNGFRPKTILMTSSGPAEGKTTVTCNLAIALAEIKKRTLLIDADLRKPRIHTIFMVNNEKGLSTLLEESTVDQAAVMALIQETTVPGLFILPSGPSTQAAASLLYSNSLQEIFRIANQHFEMVLIDTPPMLQMPDARVVSRFTDGVVLVARAGHTTRDAAQAVRQRLAQDQTPILGTILNDWDPKNSSGGYYGYYKGGSYYKGGYGYSDNRYQNN